MNTPNLSVVEIKAFVPAKNFALSMAFYEALGIPVFDANDVTELAVYIDGADEIDHAGYRSKAAAQR